MIWPEGPWLKQAALGQLQAGLDLVFPPVCCFCRRVCLPIPDHPGICRHCLAGLPLRFSRQQRLEWPDDAIAYRQPATPILCAAFYRSPIRETLIRFKFADAPELAVPLSGLLIHLLQRQAMAPAAVVAVPLHAKRLQERGYNQSALLAGLISRHLDWPDLSEGLCRTRATRRQSEMAGRAERQANLAGAFTLNGPFWQHWLQARPDSARPPAWPILLVDDVLTTGATLAAAAQPLRQAGFTVTGLVVASDDHRTVRPVPHPDKEPGPSAAAW